MRCTQCAAVSYSAAARTLVSRGERCSQCGGEVVLDPHEPAVAVGTAQPADAAERSGKRFERD